MLKGKVAIVTGSGRGIGKEIALMMAEQGAAVIVNDLGADIGGEGKETKLADEVVSEIKAKGGKAASNYGSVASFDDANAMVRQAVEEFGRLDIIVNNAGILRDRIFHKMTEEEWDAVIAVHLKGTFNTTRAAAQTFRDQGGGSVINFTSTSGLLGNYGQTNYGAAKLGIVGFSRNAALDMEKFGVLVNCVAPFAWTRLTQSIPGGDDPENKRLENLKKMDPKQIAPLCCYLGSDDAKAKKITGQVFCVRGNEIILFSLPRPKRSIHKSGGWTPQDVADIMPEAFATDFSPLTTSGGVLSYEPLF